MKSVVMREGGSKWISGAYIANYRALIPHWILISDGNPTYNNNIVLSLTIEMFHYKSSQLRYIIKTWKSLGYNLYKNYEYSYWFILDYEEAVKAKCFGSTAQGMMNHMVGNLVMVGVLGSGLITGTLWVHSIRPFVKRLCFIWDSP